MVVLSWCKAKQRDLCNIHEYCCCHFSWVRKACIPDSILWMMILVTCRAKKIKFWTNGDKVDTIQLHNGECST